MIPANLLNGREWLSRPPLQSLILVLPYLKYKVYGLRLDE